VEHVKKISSKQELIPLNLALCLTNYKTRGQTFDKLIVDLYKPPNHELRIATHNHLHNEHEKHLIA